MFFDRSLNISGAGPRILFISPNKDKLCYVLRIHFPASNNAAEYEACLHGIRLAVELGVKCLYVHGDLALVINQLNNEWDTSHEKMDLYCKEIQKWESNFYDIEYTPCGPGQKLSSRCTVKDRIISGLDPASRFRSGHSHAKRRDRPGRQVTQRSNARR